ncbi:MAG: DUF302 domain-containing protein [Candidatus Sericytochromatia bacterium]|nr:DUF302 domain-containing protein [Candidatus Sericytochromatia bacterium]
MTTAVHWYYTADSDKGFEAAVAAVGAAAAAHGFRVLHVHDVAATLAAKGFERAPYSIVEICQASMAWEVLEVEIHAGLMLPCKISVYTASGQTRISALRPALMAMLFPGSGLEDLAERIDKDVIAIVDAAR